MPKEFFYRHREHSPDWSGGTMGYPELNDQENALQIAEELSEDWAEDPDDELEKGSIFDDIQIMTDGKIVSF